MPIVLLCGYKRTGKDSVYETLSTHRSNYIWQIYRDPEKFGNEFPPRHNRKVSRIAFADSLKDEVRRLYPFVCNVLDNEKDEKLFQMGEIPVSLRDIYKIVGSEKRQADPEHWCKLALQDLTRCPINMHYTIVTDWRYQNELEYIRHNFSDIITVRIYRSSVIEPDLDDETEHDLDNITTDILLLPINEDFGKVSERFPQYAHYRKSGVI